jgi:hypothetical protein
MRCAAAFALTVVLALAGRAGATTISYATNPSAFSSYDISSQNAVSGPATAIADINDVAVDLAASDGNGGAVALWYNGVVSGAFAAHATITSLSGAAPAYLGLVVVSATGWSETDIWEPDAIAFEGHESSRTGVSGSVDDNLTGVFAALGTGTVLSSFVGALPELSLTRSGSAVSMSELTPSQVTSAGSPITGPVRIGIFLASHADPMASFVFELDLPTLSTPEPGALALAALGLGALAARKKRR